MQIINHHFMEIDAIKYMLESAEDRMPSMMQMSLSSGILTASIQEPVSACLGMSETVEMQSGIAASMQAIHV